MKEAYTPISLFEQLVELVESIHNIQKDHQALLITLYERMEKLDRKKEKR